LSKRGTWTIAAVVLVVGVSACGGSDEPRRPLSSKEVFEKAQSGVVELFGKQGDEETGGTGFIIDAEQGHVVTNAHVVNGITGLQARFRDEEPVPTRVLGSSFCNDLALVEMTSVPSGAEALPLGDSDLVENQDEVTLLGYPSSLENPEEQDIVSTSGRVQSPDVTAESGPALPKLPRAIQHSATGNPGNSGGPLLNDQGEVVGIHVASNIGTEEQRIQGQHYAISSNNAKEELDTLRAGASVDEIGWDIDPFAEVPLSEVFPAAGLGSAKDGETADRILADQGLDGLWVWGTRAGTPSEKAEITTGDLVTAIDDTDVTDVPSVCEVLQSASPGQTLRVDGAYVTSGRSLRDLGKPWSVEMKLPKGP
jgi:S1-C subfamily serine protease